MMHPIYRGLKRSAHSSPMVAPLMRGNSAKLSSSEAGIQARACTHSEGDQVRSTISTSGTMMWPMAKMVK